MNLARAAFVAAAVVCLAQDAYYFGRLPAVVASHFGPSGAPDAWMPRAGFAGLYAFVVLFLAAALTLSTRRAKALPDSRLNLPRKDYWLAPERREATLSEIEARMFVFGAATFVLLFDVFGQAFRVGRGQAPQLDHPRLSLGLYTSFIVVWMTAFVRRLRRVPPA